ncbi:MAG: ATP-binding protein [Promethearchaeota archaeon]
MISIFINREEELALLEREWKKTTGSLVILHGRRRIGKTRLLLEFCSDKKGIFYIAEDSSVQIQIEGLKAKIAELLNDQLLETLNIQAWDQLFEYLNKNAPNERFYLVIDEFTYLIKSDKRILSILQKYWDTAFSSANILILLSGSLLGLMSEKVLSYSSPLYGRRSRDILLGGLSFFNSCKFLNMKFEDQLKAFFIIGGIPEYLLKASEYNDLNSFLEGEFFNKQGYFYREPHFIISQEFREIKTYFSIMNAIAFGNTKPSRIANFVGINTREIYPYLENLMRLGFVERETPLIGNQKKGLYFIKDEVFDFWFNFIHKYREEIERRMYNLETKSFDPFFGKKFEKFCLLEVVPKLLPNVSKIGRWWYKKEEIDIIAINEQKKEIIFIECKWSDLNAQKSNQVIENLKRKTPSVRWNNEDRVERFGILAHGIKNKKSLISKNIIALDLEDFQSLLRK